MKDYCTGCGRAIPERMPIGLAIGLGTLIGVVGMSAGISIKKHKSADTHETEFIQLEEKKAGPHTKAIACPVCGQRAHLLKIDNNGGTPLNVYNCPNHWVRTWVNGGAVCDVNEKVAIERLFY